MNITSPEELLIEQERARMLDHFRDGLEAKEYEFLILRADGKTLEEIGEDPNIAHNSNRRNGEIPDRISKQAVQQLERRVKAKVVKLREKLGI